jgi:hypothetical protein
MGGVAVLKDIDSEIKDNKLSYEIDSSGVAISSLAVLSPETGNNSINAEIRHIKNDRLVLNVNLEGIKIYAVAQNIK